MSFLKSVSFQKRALSSVVLGPLVLLIVWYGSWPFTILLAGGFCVAVYEWFPLVKNRHGAALYMFIGAVYIAGGFYSLYLLRDGGFDLLFLLLVSVWASDTGAYFFGKFIGGPRLIPRVSPNKTWAGLGGAMFCPALIMLLFVYGFNIFPENFMPFFIFLGLAIGLSGQVGDLLVSALKRKADAKDTGNLIPGHGGLLDRIDSLLLAAPVFYLFVSMFLL